MSGLDEGDKLWVLKYDEYCYEDYITCYRGIMAHNFNEAVRLGKIWIDYLNLEHNSSEDEDNPDYKFRIIIDSAETSTFMLDKEYLESAEQSIRDREE